MSTTAPATSADALRLALQNGTPLTVLDIRPAGDRAEWWIPGSTHFEAYDGLKQGDPDVLAGADLPTDRPVVVVCRAGVVAHDAALWLAERGLDASYLAGGMKAWSQAWNHALVPVVGPDAAVIQVRRTGKGCLSYLVGSRGEAAVIDPSAAPAVYVDLAGEQGWDIRAVLDTHVHADHVSRGRELAQLTGAAILLPAQAPVHYRFQPLREGDRLAIGAATLTVRARRATRRRASAIGSMTRPSSPATPCSWAGSVDPTWRPPATRQPSGLGCSTAPWLASSSFRNER